MDQISTTNEVVELACRLAEVYFIFSLKSQDEIRLLFKQFKPIFTTKVTYASNSTFFIRWAYFELKNNHISKALTILQNALKEEVHSIVDLDAAIRGICEENAIPSELTDLNTIFTQRSQESTASMETVGKKLNTIFASLYESKRQHNQHENVQNNTVNDTNDDDFFTRIEQRLNAFNESLSNATKRKESLSKFHIEKTEHSLRSIENRTLSSEKKLNRSGNDSTFSLQVLSRANGEHTSNSNSSKSLNTNSCDDLQKASENTENELLNNNFELSLDSESIKTEHKPSKHDLMIAAIRKKSKRVSFSPSSINSEKPQIPLPKIMRKKIVDENTDIVDRLLCEDELNETHSAPLRDIDQRNDLKPALSTEDDSPKTSSSSLVSICELQQKVKIIQINNKKYQILQLIGKGGSSKVYKVLGTDYQIYALKRVHLEGLDNATVEGYMNEIDLLQKLSHNPWIIKLLDTNIDKQKGILQLLMEYGEIDLAAMLNEKRKEYSLPTSDATYLNFIRYFWQQILHSVQSIHNERIIHCDLKPANFILVKGTLKLIDFGISKAIQSNETANVVLKNQVGTVNYMAPEALTDISNSSSSQLKIGRPSDVWSLGCILYEMVYGIPPFGTFSVIQRIHKIIDSSFQISYPSFGCPSLVDSIKGCLERDQSRRFTICNLLENSFLSSS